MTAPILTISLEPHLIETLKPLPPLLPPGLSEQLLRCIDSTSTASRSDSWDTSDIPYDLLSSISQWSRTKAGATALQAHKPPLDVHAYEMISLLAGTRSNPRRKFPQSVSESEQREEERKRNTNDRKAITTILNAMLSIGGSGFAAWYCAGRVGWRDEWKVLLALLVAAVVAISEAVLYVIWESRHSDRAQVKKSPSGATAVRRQRIEEDIPTEHSEEVPVPVLPTLHTVRRRQPFDDNQSDPT